MSLLRGVSLNFVLAPNDATALFGPPQLALLQQSGAQVARVDLHLKSTPLWTQPVIDAYTAVLDQIAGAGITVLGLLGPGILYQNGGGQAAWNQNPAEMGGTGTNDWQQQYTDAAQQVVQAFPHITLWECLNEPNAWTSHSGQTYAGGTYMYPSLYAGLLQSVYPAIKAINPDATLITGGLLAHTNSGPSWARSAADYLDALYNCFYMAGNPFAFDVIGWHCYIDQSTALVPEHLQRYLNNLLGVITWYEGEQATRPVAVTEIGWSTRSVTPQAHASNLSAAYNVFANNQYVNMALNYQLVDGGGQSFGLYDMHNAAKPSLAAFQAAP